MTTSQTTYGQDIDTFISQYISADKKRLATAELNLICLKAIRTTLVEMQKKFSPTA